jgi:hypothetical protein
MKQLATFRLGQHSAAAIDAVSKALGISKTQVVEQAVQEMARKVRASKHPLLQFAGTLSAKEADKMLDTIRTSRRSKP